MAPSRPGQMGTARGDGEASNHHSGGAGAPHAGALPGVPDRTVKLTQSHQGAASPRADHRTIELTRFPQVRLEPDVLFVDDGDILTASGSASALDLGLHVVRRDHGAEIANAVSRRLVFAAHRDGGQRQFVERPVPDIPDESLAPVLAWAQERLDEPLTVGDLAARAAVSPATLHRRFRAQLGTTPLAWLTGERVALACRLIERGEERLDVVAARSGLGTAANLRARLRAETGLSPSAYRRRFGPAPGEALTV